MQEIVNPAMIVRETSALNVAVEESGKRVIDRPEYILQMDKIVMKNGHEFVVAKANQNEIELMPTTRLKIKKSDLATFLATVKHIIRADCFEKQ